MSDGLKGQSNIVIDFGTSLYIFHIIFFSKFGYFFLTDLPTFLHIAFSPDQQPHATSRCLFFDLVHPVL